MIELNLQIQINNCISLKLIMICVCRIVHLVGTLCDCREDNIYVERISICKQSLHFTVFQNIFHHGLLLKGTHNMHLDPKHKTDFLS